MRLWSARLASSVLRMISRARRSRLYAVSFAARGIAFLSNCMTTPERPVHIVRTVRSLYTFSATRTLFITARYEMNEMPVAANQARAGGQPHRQCFHARPWLTSFIDIATRSIPKWAIVGLVKSLVIEFGPGAISPRQAIGVNGNVECS
jgi:hypothetical protein